MAKNKTSQLKIMFIGLLIIFFLFLAFALYKRKDLLQNCQLAEGFHEDEINSNKTIAFRLFYTNWCPHCQRIKPEWNLLKNSWDMAKRQMYWQNNKLTYKDVKIEMVNCEKDQTQCKQLDVQGYPTIILSIGNKNIEYTGKTRTNTELMRFLESKLLENGISYK